MPAFAGPAADPADHDWSAFHEIGLMYISLVLGGCAFIGSGESPVLPKPPPGVWRRIQSSNRIASRASFPAALLTY